ncbi:MAG: undecaprenyldiphospho-muramoylpentapeptide beta-N-acetylglucosaminyltransferase [Pseudomonadota bacterium]|nr:undecaprenyldiphospho-muramoylpentapeptide beta-N-acetylglucosaminyltransferase [Pseudomonadota bacterium]
MSGLVVLAAGGTGGHLFPARALAAELKSRGRTLVLVTDHRGAGFGDSLGDVAVHTVRAAAVTGRGLLGRLGGLANVALGVFQARRLLARLRPSGVVGFGGYASVPAVLAAAQLGLPTVIHEQNAVLGRANRLLAPRARAIATSFAETSRLAAADQARAEHTGNPVRQEVAAIGEKPYPAPQPGEPLSILITGGSQGAAVMTHVVPGALSSLSGQPPRHRLRVVQQCRPEDVDRARATYRTAGIEAEVAAFFDDLPARLGAAQVVIARAGASTVAELTAAGRPAILVPLPTATDDHQSAKARTLEAAGGGWVMDQDGFTPEALAARIAELRDRPDRLAAAAANAKAAGAPQAASHLADLVERCMPCHSDRHSPGEMAA